MYELEDHNVLRSAAFLDTVRYQPSPERTRFSGGFVGRNYLLNGYRQIFPARTNPIDDTMGPAPFLQMGRIDIAASMEEEFNDWYNTAYIPGYLTVPGCLRARRYLAVEGQPKYLTVYEFENAGVPDTQEWARARNGNPWNARMRPHVRLDDGLACRIPPHIPNVDRSASWPFADAHCWAPQVRSPSRHGRARRRRRRSRSGTRWAARQAGRSTKLIDAFNASQDQVQVTGLFKGVYKDLMTVGCRRMARRPGAAYRAGVRSRHPDHDELRSGHQAGLAARARNRREARPERLHPRGARLLQPADGRLMSMPFNSSTCIVWYNLGRVLQKAGLDPEKFPVDLAEVVSLDADRCATRTRRSIRRSPSPRSCGRISSSSARSTIFPSPPRRTGSKASTPMLKVNSPAHFASTCSGCWIWRRRAVSTTPAATAAATARSSAASPA